MIPTGSETLDEVLNGGYPAGRTTLLVGTPGTGKSTLAMQFLQAGLEADEDCLFVSTEQPVDELREAFAPFGFDLDHPALSITTLHARTGRTIDSDEPELVIESFVDDEVLGEGLSAPFTSKRILQALEQYSDADRVVLDSVSGLRPMANDDDVYRRGVLDLIELFTETFGATSVFTAEHVATAPRTQPIETLAAENAVQYSTYGVIRLWRKQVRGSFRRYLDVMKMRGVDHDTRQFEVKIGDDGVHVVPRNRAMPAKLALEDPLPTGVANMDELIGGGMPLGTGTLLEHDGQADLKPFLYAISTTAIEEGLAIGLVPRVNISPENVDDLFRRAGTSAEALMDEDRLFVVDAIGAWERQDNVFNLQYEDAGLRYILQQIDDRHGGNGLLLFVNTEAIVHALGAEETRQFRYWVEANQLGDRDLLIDVHNPKLMGREMADFFVDAASQVVETWREETGLQYLKLRKGLVGDIGCVRLVDHIEEPPYIRLE